MTQAYYDAGAVLRRLVERQRQQIALLRKELKRRQAVIESCPACWAARRS